jgi:hypothetical protein
VVADDLVLQARGQQWTQCWPVTLTTRQAAGRKTYVLLSVSAVAGTVGSQPHRERNSTSD